MSTNIASAGEHSIWLYESDTDLAETASTYLAKGIDIGDSVVVVSSTHHLSAIRRQLQQRHYDVEALKSARLYHEFAATQIDRLTALGQESAMSAVGEELAKILDIASNQGQRNVRLVCEPGSSTQACNGSKFALKLEKTWNSLRAMHKFNLFCIYPKRDFLTDIDEEFNLPFNAPRSAAGAAGYDRLIPSEIAQANRELTQPQIQSLEDRQLDQAQYVTTQGKMQMVAAIARLGVWEYDAESETLTTCEQCRANFGLRPQDHFSYADLLGSIHPEHRQRFLDIWHDSIESVSGFNEEFQIITPDGNTRWIAMIGKSLHDRLHWMMGVIQDTTERKLMLEEIQSTNARQKALLRDVLTTVTDGRLCLCDRCEDLPSPKAYIQPPVTMTRESLWHLRHQIEEEAKRLQFPDARWEDLITAVGEASMNAVVHAGGGWATISSDGCSTIQVRIQDEGPGIDPEHIHKATIQRGFTTSGSFGHGFWMLLTTADRIWLQTGKTGTTLVLEQDVAPPEADWLKRLTTDTAPLEEQPTHHPLS